MANRLQAIKSLIKNPAIVIALATVLVSLLAFFRELGFCHFFNIPIDYISLSPINSLNLILSFAGIFAFLIFTGVFPFIIAQLPTTLPRRIIGLFVYIGFLFIIITVFLLISDIIKIKVFIAFLFSEVFRSVLLGYGLQFISFFIIGLVANRRNIRPTETAKQLRPLSDSEHLAVILKIILIAVAVALLSWGSYMDGRNYAKIQPEFQVIPKSTESNRPEVVILRIYGDNLITAPVVTPVKPEGNNQIEKTLYIFKLSEMDKTPLTLKKVGPLTVEQ
jgi:hypothetical protein